MGKMINKTENIKLFDKDGNEVVLIFMKLNDTQTLYEPVGITEGIDSIAISGDYEVRIVKSSDMKEYPYQGK